MRVEGDFVVFERLRRSDADFDGGEQEVRAIANFQAANAPASLLVDELRKYEERGRAAADRLAAFFSDS